MAETLLPERAGPAPGDPSSRAPAAWGPWLPALVGLLRDVPSRLARRTSGVYRREIDGLRFFAIFIVLIGHLCERSERFATAAAASQNGVARAFFYLLERPGMGVELFFMISGFVIFSPLAGKARDAINPKFISFYFKRRLLRIEPPYLLLLIATYLLITLTGFVPPETHRFQMEPKSLTTSLFASLAYSHGWLFGTPPRLLGPGWSLEIEIQFYALAPAIFFAYLSLARRPVRAMAGAVVLALSLVASGSVGTYASAPHWEYTLVNFFPLFWTGILVCDFEPELRALLSAAPTVLGEVIGWAGLAILMTVLPSTAVGIGPKTLQIATLVAGCFMMFLGILRRESAFCRFCASRWVSLIGSACYSLYLVHLQIMQIGDSLLSRLPLPAALTSPLPYLLLSAVTVLPLAIACGLTFYAVVERTFMLKDWPQRFAGFVRGAFASPRSDPRAP